MNILHSGQYDTLYNTHSQFFALIGLHGSPSKKIFEQLTLKIQFSVVSQLFYLDIQRFCCEGGNIMQADGKMISAT